MWVWKAAGEECSGVTPWVVKLFWGVGAVHYRSALWVWGPKGRVQKCAEGCRVLWTVGCLPTTQGHAPSGVLDQLPPSPWVAQAKGGPSRVAAEVIVRRRRHRRGAGDEQWEFVRARGHLDEVLEIRNITAATGAAAAGPDGSGGGINGSTGVGSSGSKGSANGGLQQLVLTEGQVLGGGAFSRVSIVTEGSTGRAYALKRMRKSGVVQVGGWLGG